jgi:protein-S-isoprenylcysteine O-methyltransferase Ste14
VTQVDATLPLAVRIGGWLFRQRTWLPLPLVAGLLLLPADESAPRWLIAVGCAAIAAGEAIRVWAVRHIGPISRTRSDRLGPVVSTGPFGYVRNPLYLGNVALWVGFALAARLPWFAPMVAVVLGLEYQAIVRWEEMLLSERRADEYRAYAARVPRWMPSFRRASFSRPSIVDDRQSWLDTFFSERGTLIAIAVGLVLLWAKTRW